MHFSFPLMFLVSAGRPAVVSAAELHEGVADAAGELQEHDRRS